MRSAYELTNYSHMEGNMLFQKVELQEYRHTYLRKNLLCLHEVTADFLIIFYIFLFIKDISTAYLAYRGRSEHCQYSYQRSFSLGTKIFGNVALVYPDNGKCLNKTFIRICVP